MKSWWSLFLINNLSFCQWIELPLIKIDDWSIELWLWLNCVDWFDCPLNWSNSSKFSIYSIADLNISTFGNLWFGFVHVLFFNDSNASLT